MKTRTLILLTAPFLLALALATPATSRAGHDGKIQIVLLGDSMTEGSIPRLLAPKEPQLEDVIRLLLAAESDLPPTHVTNLGLSGEFIRRLIDSGRYEKQASKLPGLDYIFIRYGQNDMAKREDFEANFPKDYHELLAKLRADHPQAMLIPMTVIPVSEKVNKLIHEIAVEEKLTLFDVCPRWTAERERGRYALSIRRFPLAKIPEKLRAFAQPYVMPGKEPEVVVLDNRLDAHFGNLPGWFADAHANLAGYHVIGDETAKFLAPIIRGKSKR